jgi:glycosyltransferase involved in cell wall biosynthesis
MSLSVLICVHSQNNFYDDLLIRSLKSLEDQTYTEFQTFLVLDECWEPTKKIVEDKINLEINYIEKNKKEGLSFAKNLGLKNINTELVCFLDADDLYIKDKLEKQISFFNKNDIDFLGTHAYNIYDDDNLLFDSCFNSDQYNDHESIKEIIFNENVLTHGSMMIKKKCLTDLNYYNNVKGQEDWDLWKRAITKGYKFHQMNDRLYVYRLNTSVLR